MMKKHKITLAQAIKFHGHLGPYLVIGIMAGEAALKKLKCKKYFGLEAKVWGALKKPRSCLIDGLQLSTGATYGKGNISKAGGAKISILFINRENNKKMKVSLKERMIDRLDSLKGHKEAEAFARRLYKADPSSVFNTVF
jgi:formylmethanofuran dehydrogenase subunit E